MLLNVHDWVPVSTQEGPGKRFVIWVQGCHLQCPGCCNRPTWEIDIRQLMDVQEICHLILESKAKYQIEGITLLGGEPMLQARALVEIARFCNQQDLGVITFSGLDWEEIQDSEFPGSSALLSASDLCISGRYDFTQPESLRNWVGSTNQVFHYLSDRYPLGMEYDPGLRNRVELSWLGGDSLVWTGRPDPRLQKQVRQGLTPKKSPPVSLDLL